MASYTVATGEHGAYSHQLTAGVVDTVTFTAALEEVTVTSDGTAAIYVTVDGTTPTVAGAATWELPAYSPVERTILLDADAPTVVKVISAGTPVYSVAHPDGAEEPEQGTVADEETRAREFREQLARRAAYQRTQQQRLAGSQAARAALEEAWRPVIEAARERVEDGCR